MNRQLIELAKDSLNLIELARERGVVFKGDSDGERAYCQCPFHDDSHASMAMSPRFATCYAGGCGWNGDVLDWVQECEGWDFTTTLRWLCEKAGIPWNKPGAREVESLRVAQQHARHLTLVEKAAELYRKELRGESYDYAKRRGISDEVLEKFMVGYCPDDHDTVGEMIEAGFKVSELREAKLVVGKERDHPRFAGKLVVPIHWMGKVVNMYGRSLDDNDSLRHDYILRHRMCFGWDECRRDKRVKGSKTVFAAEGLIDALVCWSAGIPTLALYGTEAMRSVWAGRIKKAGIERLVYIPDADGVEGQKCALEVASMFYQHGVRVNVVDLPEGEDPASYGAKDYKALRAAVREAVEENVTPIDYAERHGLLDEDSPPLLRVDQSDLCLECSGYSIKIHSTRKLREGLSGVFSFERGGKIVHRDKLNTWSSRSRQQYVRAAGLTGPEASEATRRLMNIEDDIERHEKNGRRTEEDEADVLGELDSKVKAQAEELLKDKNLIRRIAADITTCGYVGEDRAKVLLYLIATGRLMPEPAHCCIMSSSSTGKSALVKAVARLMPEDSVVEMSAMSSRALFHLEPDSLKHRWVIMAERTGYDETANHAVRLLQSEGHLRYMVATKNEEEQIETVEKVVEGPLAWTETTTDQENDLNPENLNRMIVVYLDESEEQTRRIHEYQKMMVTEDSLTVTTERARIAALHQAAQKLLKPNLRVVIPFAELIRFPVDFVRARRDLQKVLTIVAASATLHQYQRRQDVVQGVDVVYAEPFDYRVAHGLYSLLLRQAYVGLPKKSEELIGIIGKNVSAVAKKRNNISPTSITFKRRDVQEWSHWPLRQVVRALEPLEEAEFLEARYEGGKGNPASYTLTGAWNGYGADTVVGMTTPQELELAVARLEERPNGRGAA